MSLEPQYTIRVVADADTREVGQYEVLQELFRLWKQAWDAWDAVMRHGNKLGEITRVTVEARRETWEQAIMVYCGWTGTELNHWLAEKMEALGEKFSG